VDLLKITRKWETHCDFILCTEFQLPLLQIWLAKRDLRLVLGRARPVPLEPSHHLRDITHDHKQVGHNKQTGNNAVIKAPPLYSLCRVTNGHSTARATAVFRSASVPYPIGHH
jgi:hypothetical protein